MKWLKVFAGSILAGLAIGLGGLVYLSVENKVLGAFLFSVGLFTVCTMGLSLFTGKVCYVFSEDRSYALSLPVIWLGNLAGTGCAALFASLTRAYPVLQEKAVALTQVKTGDSLSSLFFLGVLCNVFIYIAVEGYRSIPQEIGKYLAIVFGVMAFILSGTEHCVADMFYFWMAGAWNLRAVICILVITLGNCAGGVLLPTLRKFQQG